MTEIPLLWVTGIYFDVMEIQPLVQGVYRFDQNGQPVCSIVIQSAPNRYLRSILIILLIIDKQKLEV